MTVAKKVMNLVLCLSLLAGIFLNPVSSVAGEDSGADENLDQLFPSNPEEEDCPDCTVDPKNLEEPQSTGTEEEQQKAIEITENSSEFQSTSRTLNQRQYNEKLFTVNVEKDENAYQAVTTYQAKKGKKTVVSQYFVDLEDERLILKRSYDVKQLNDNMAKLKLTVDDNVIYDVKLKDDQVITKDGHTYDGQDFIEKKTEEINSQVKASFWCEYIVGALCGGAGAAGCWAAAAALGITTGVGGVSLAVICGMIGAVGCTATVSYVC
ncbi:halocin C8-like domain-containing protein [Alteribacillus bidgolensis]|uniref:Halocin C8-like bacteriocin domain-containing protein n=1 Tax=Alteribacillus bidgolensis TaxID=930129 RepID=A0A1G8NNL8_9BACI|nr:halocin C8-like domain-containing protein [Alteribacillus bidgolensis]SDI81794.1 halocin C8-like bacteriocin domain-containing protein [Alteribacillus bidgolensis]